MDKYVNFYENIQEAHIRLRSTVVLYDKTPYHIIAICAHNPDGIFRVYLDPIDYDTRTAKVFPRGLSDFNPADQALGHFLDKFLEDNPTTRIIRKKMDSSYFNKFRPFPLGMCNFGTGCFYLERAPQRQREQGLTRQMIYQTAVQSAVSNAKIASNVDIYSPAFHSCVVASHPTAEECLKNLLDPLVENEAVAFDRNFALVRGPLDMLFLGYKTEIIGVLPKNDFTFLRLGRDFGYCKEVVEELRLFNSVI